MLPSNLIMLDMLSLLSKDFMTSCLHKHSPTKMKWRKKKKKKMKEFDDKNLLFMKMTF